MFNGRATRNRSRKSESKRMRGGNVRNLTRTGGVRKNEGMERKVLGAGIVQRQKGRTSLRGCSDTEETAWMY